MQLHKEQMGDEEIGENSSNNCTEEEFLQWECHDGEIIPPPLHSQYLD